MDISAWVWAWTILSLLGLGAALQVLLLRIARGRMAMRTHPGELPWNGARQFLFGMLLVADVVIIGVLTELAIGGVYNVLHPPLTEMDAERVRLMAAGRTITALVLCAYVIGLIATWYVLDRLQDEDDAKRRKLIAALGAPVPPEPTHHAVQTGFLDAAPGDYRPPSVDAAYDVDVEPDAGEEGEA